MILHIPHSGTDTLGINISQHDINRGTNWFTNELFSHSDAESIVQKNQDSSLIVNDCLMI